MTTTIPADLARCPNSHTGAVTERSRADVLARRLLRVPDHAGALTDRAAIQPFRRSMMTSTIRCMLTYLVFPFVLPTLNRYSGDSAARRQAVASTYISWATRHAGVCARHRSVLLNLTQHKGNPPLASGLPRDRTTGNAYCMTVQ